MSGTTKSSSAGGGHISNYLPGASVPMLEGSANHSMGETRMTVHFMGIGVSRLVSKNNPLQSSSLKYEAQNVKSVASIYTRLNDGDINLMGTCFDTNELMTKLRNQYANKRWGAESIAYQNLHKIMYEECEDMTDYIRKLRAAHVRLSSMGFTIDPKCLVYILIMGLPKEFDVWATAVQNAS